MTREEIEAVAAAVAKALRRRGWIEPPVRPEPPAGPSPGNLPPWAGSAQALGDVAPSRSGRGRGGRHRPAYDALAVAARAAAAGTGPSPSPSSGRAQGGPKRAGRSVGRTVPVAVSNRHIHVSQETVEALFGAGYRLSPDRPIRQPGQFASRERVRVVGPGGAIEGVRIVGPARGITQVELTVGDCRAIGVAAPVRPSGATGRSAPIRLEGPAGGIDLPEGAIVASRHLHLSPEDASRFGLRDGDTIDVEIGAPERRVTVHRVLVRSGDTHATELHVDVDEANAFGLTGGEEARLVGRPARGGRPAAPSRRLVTERDVQRLAAEGRTLSSGGPDLVTPAARDRAKALGIWREGR